jgi:expansin (peptidoglycan-binding protein)
MASVIIGAAALAVSGTASAVADSTGTKGAVVSVQTVTTASSYTGNFRGLATIGADSYYWGGAFCSSFAAPSDTQIDWLVHAMLNKAQVTPYYQTQVNGASSYKCLVRFQIHSP